MCSNERGLFPFLLILNCLFSKNRTQAPIALSVLGEIVQPAIKPWDILQVHQGLETDLNHQTAEDITLENLHKAAFRFLLYAFLLFNLFQQQALLNRFRLV